MPSSPLDLLTRRVKPAAPAAPSFTLASAIREAAREFCERTRCWRQEASVVLEADDVAALPPGRPWDALPIPLGVYPEEPATATATIHEIEVARWGDRSEPLEAVPFAQLSPADRSGQGRPRFISHASGNAVILAPREAGTLHLSLFLKPSSLNPIVSAYVIPLSLVDRFGDDITHGALGRLLAMPGTPWLQPELAAYHASAFETACNKHFNAGSRGPQRAPRRARSSFGF